MVITKDASLVEAAREGFHPTDELVSTGDWNEGLELTEGADLVFVDLVATLTDPHKIGGYERFARAKMNHPVAASVPLVLIAPAKEYELDFMAGWPDFVFAHLRQPVDHKVFRRASTWV